ncbi:MAG: hypothetical protein NTV97_12065 [Alphaproteobacteria bacterium]|nr:hypothetical protein [Alphaproteobacteria bacterium]
MSNPVQRARQDLDRIDAQIKALQAERDGVSAFIRMYDRYATENAVAPAATLHTPPLKARLLDATVRFLGERGRPAFMSDIYPMLEAAGLLPGGTNPKQQVSSIFGRDGRLEFKSATGWWLKGAAPTTTAGEARTLM